MPRTGSTARRPRRSVLYLIVNRVLTRPPLSRQHAKFLVVNGALSVWEDSSRSSPFFTCTFLHRGSILDRAGDLDRFKRSTSKRIDRSTMPRTGGTCAPLEPRGSSSHRQSCFGSTALSGQQAKFLVVNGALSVWEDSSRSSPFFTCTFLHRNSILDRIKRSRIAWQLQSPQAA